MHIEQLQPQHVIITDDSGVTWLVSSGVILVKKYRNQITLDELRYNGHSLKGRYRNMFLNETIKETQAKIDSGEYILEDLNKEII